MIHDILPVNNYVGNSSATTFDFDFYIEDSSQLEVYIFDNNEIKTKLTENVDYTIHELKNINGSYITFPIAGSSYDVLDSNHKLSIMLSLPLSQETEYNNSSLLNLSSLEYSLDYLTRLIQIVSRKTDLCVKIEECSSVQPSALIDLIKEKANNALNAANLALGYLNSAIEYYNSNYQIYQNISQFQNKFDSIDTMQANMDTIMGQFDYVVKSDGSTIPSTFYTSFINNATSIANEYFSHSGMPNYSSSNLATFNRYTWYTAQQDGWIHYGHTVGSATHGRIKIKDPNGNVVFYVIAGGGASQIETQTMFCFLPKGYSAYIEAEATVNYNISTANYNSTLGAYFIPSY